MTGVLRSTAFSTGKIEEDMIDKVIEAFNSNLFEFFTLWEKIITLLYINGNEDKLIEFIENLTLQINELNFNYDSLEYHLNEEFDDCELVKDCLMKYLFSTVVRVLSLKSTSIYKNINNFNNFEKTYLYYSFNFIFSSMINNNYMKYPLQNTINVENMIRNKHDDGNTEINYNLINNNECDENHRIFTGFCYPRYIKFHELLLHNLYNTIYLKPYKNYFEDDLPLLINMHAKLNFYEEYPKNKINTNIEKYIIQHCDLNCHNHEDCPVNEIYKTMKIDSKTQTKLKVGLVNTKLEYSDFENRLIGKPNLTRDRYDRVKRLINDAIRNDVDLLLMPEMYIPFEWMNEIINVSKTHQMAMIFGMEPIVNNNVAYNYIITSLPFTVDDSYFETMISCRLKNHYAPAESQIIKSLHLNTPTEEYKYYLFSWRGIHIVPYYCYEIADVESRSKFKNCCDIVAVSEFNKDELYFGNIAESLSRDLYCYCIKSNTSEFGGTSIIQPAPSEMRKIIDLKGGENDYLVVHELDINKLRKNAIKSDLMPNNKDDTLKPNPPGINVDIIKERMHLESKYLNKEYKNPYDDIPPYIIEKRTDNFISHLDKDISDKTFGIWGLCLKPNTPEIDASPSLNIIKKLSAKGAKIKVYDPLYKQFKDRINEPVEYCMSKYDATDNIDALIILTGWEEFKQCDLNEMEKQMKKKIIFDCRNIIKHQPDSRGFKIYRICINKTECDLRL